MRTHREGGVCTDAQVAHQLRSIPVCTSGDDAEDHLDDDDELFYGLIVMGTTTS